MQLIKNRPALGMIGYALFMNLANDNLFVVYGVWLERTFNLNVVALGLGTIGIGLAELAGSGLTVLQGDRFGLRRSLIYGSVLTIFSYGILPILASSLALGLGGLFIIFFIFEFTIVIGISLSTEILPGSRATMIAALYAASGVGRVIGALIGMPIWLIGGITATVLASAFISFLALAFMLGGLKDWRR